MKKGFTIIELIVVIAITVVLLGIVLFSVSEYIKKGKDSNISANLAILIPAGETFYNINNSYQNFCSSSIVANAKSQMPANTQSRCYNNPANLAGVCCNTSSTADGYQSWAACVREFSDTTKAYCVDSRGTKKDISHDSQCIPNITVCP